LQTQQPFSKSNYPKNFQDSSKILPHTNYNGFGTQHQGYRDVNNQQQQAGGPGQAVTTQTSAGSVEPRLVEETTIKTIIIILLHITVAILTMDG